MSILNREGDGNLSVLLVVVKALATLGPTDEDRLVKMCAPPSAVSRTDRLTKTIARWKQLAVLEAKSGKLSLAPDIKKLPTNDINSLRAKLLRYVLAPQNNGRIEGNEDGPGSEDWTRAAAWTLLQDLYTFPTNFAGAEALQHQQGVEPRVFVNDTRWPSFVEWSVFLGIAWMTKAGPVFEPGFAIASSLDDVFGKDKQLTITDFLARLGRVLPIFESGSYATAVQRQIKRPPREARAEQVSPCVSVALERLRIAGLVRIESRSDAPQMTLVGRQGRPTQASHVRRGPQ